jgi:hypothetical protein
MVTVAQLPGRVRIEQRYLEHHPPHFHAIQGESSVSIEIALPLKVVKGTITPSAMNDVLHWAKTHRCELALNWVDALAHLPLKRIPCP